MKRYIRNIAVTALMTSVCVAASACTIKVGDKNIEIDDSIISDQAQSFSSELGKEIDAIGSVVNDASNGMSSFGELYGDTKDKIDAIKGAVDDAKSTVDDAIGSVGDVTSDADKLGVDIKGLLGGSDDFEKMMGQYEEYFTGQGIAPTGQSVPFSSSDGSTADENGILQSVLDLELLSVDGGEKDYYFVYAGETFYATYTEDNWKIVDSYKITSSSDMRIICQVLIDHHPVHGSDMKSYRTADDMAYEWQQHNIGYMILGEGNEWSSHLKDVDFDPKDQGKSIDEIYKDRTGKDFKLSDFLSDN